MKVYLSSVGCRLNQSEIESMARELLRAGHEIVRGPEGAELTIINSCTVTHKAASDSRQMARHIARASNSPIVMTGCWATLEPDLAISLPGVKVVKPNAEKDLILRELTNTSPLDQDPIERSLLTELLGRTRAFIKVQDGCDNRCTFCLTTIARGRSRSIPLPEILREINDVTAGGAQEVVLTGVQLGAWGADLPHRSGLGDLLTSILRETDIPRLRISSVEPWSIDRDFFALWENPRLCRHLHLPLQSGSEKTLKRMARQISPTKYEQLIRAALDVIPDLAITTDIIVGFPGEDEAEFCRSAAVVEAIPFAGGHVFAYSPRPGTTAATFTPQMDPTLVKSFSQTMRKILSNSAELYRSAHIGSKQQVLWEQEIDRINGKRRFKGLTGNYLRVITHTERELWNQITDTRLVKQEDDHLIGEIERADVSLV